MTTRRYVIGMVGLGHVGLSTAVSIAARGITTVGIDIDKERLKTISRGQSPFKEQSIPRLLAETVRSGKLRVTSDPSALADTEIQFITVQTPSSNDGTIDLTHVRNAASSIGKALRGSEGYKLVVVKSTVTPGTTAGVVRPMLELESHRKPNEFGLAVNPEFLREGRAIEDTMHPDRIVIGTNDERSERTLVSFYRRLYRRLPKTVLTTPVNAELVKYASNAFLATKVTFINEIANLCFKLKGADVSVVAKGMGLDKRIAPWFLRAGLGYGGSCFPKDVSALLKAAESVGVDLSVAEAAAKGNEKQPLVGVDLAESLVGGIRGKRIALLGLAFKPDSDDMRDAVSLRLVPELLRRGAEVVAYDPAAMANARRLLGEKIEYAESRKACLKGADCCIVVTEWDEFSKLRPKDFKESMRTPAVVDGRGVLNRKQFLESGVRFSAVGLG